MAKTKKKKKTKKTTKKPIARKKAKKAAKPAKATKPAEDGKHAGGRPTKYKAKYCEGIVKCFNILPTKKDEGKRVANDLKFLSQYAREIGVCHDTLLEWCKKHPEFSLAYKKAKDLQREHLITCGLLGFYNPAAFIFTAKNIAGMKDKTETIHDVADELKDFLKEIGGDGSGIPIKIKP